MREHCVGGQRRYTMPYEEYAPHGEVSIRYNAPRKRERFWTRSSAVARATPGTGLPVAAREQSSGSSSGRLAGLERSVGNSRFRCCLEGSATGERWRGPLHRELDVERLLKRKRSEETLS